MSLDDTENGPILVERLARQWFRENISKIVCARDLLELYNVAIHELSAPEVGDLDVPKSGSNDGIVGDIHCALGVAMKYRRFCLGKT